MATITRIAPTGKRYPRLIAAIALLAAIVATVALFTRVGPFAAIILPAVPATLTASDLLPAAPPAPELAAAAVAPAPAPAPQSVAPQYHAGVGSNNSGQHAAPRATAPPADTAAEQPAAAPTAAATAKPTPVPTPRPTPRPTPAPTGTAPPGGGDN